MWGRRVLTPTAASTLPRNAAAVPVPRRPMTAQGADRGFRARPTVQVARRQRPSFQSICSQARTSASLSPRGKTSMPEQLRALMRRVTHSVVVCTSMVPATTTSPPSPRAMTLSSFTSLSLSPTPVVALNIATPSRTLDAIAASRMFNVHIMAGDEAGARIADWFTRGNADSVAVFDQLHRRSGCVAETSGGHGEPPVLVGDGILYALRCKLLDDPSHGLVKVRDHVMVLGEVYDIIKGCPRERPEDAEERFGLVYSDRRYRQLGQVILPSKDES